MGKVYDMTRKFTKARPVEFSKEEEELVERLYRSISSAANKYDEIIICKAIAVYMGTLMTNTGHPGAVIGGFTKHIQQVTNMAIMAHKQKEKENAPNQEPHGVANKTDPSQTGLGGTPDAGTPQVEDRDLEGEGQEVLHPPTIQ